MERFELVIYERGVVILNISHFDSVRVGGEHIFVDVKALGHSNHCFMVEADSSINEKVEVREKEGKVAIFCFVDTEMEITGWWKDAKLLYEKRNNE